MMRTLAILRLALLFLLLERLSGQAVLAGVLAAFVALHRSHHYSVLVRTGEVDLLPNILWVAVLWLFVRYLDDRRPARYLTMAGGYLVLLFSRENYLFAAPVLAASAFWSGDIAEVIVYGRQLTAAERGSVEQYLKMKYGLVLGRDWHA